MSIKQDIPSLPLEVCFNHDKSHIVIIDSKNQAVCQSPFPELDVEKFKEIVKRYNSHDTLTEQLEVAVRALKDRCTCGFSIKKDCPECETLDRIAKMDNMLSDAPYIKYADYTTIRNVNYVTITTDYKDKDEQ